MSLEISEIRPSEYENVVVFGNQVGEGTKAGGDQLVDAASTDALEQLLRRHPGLSLAARDGGRIVGMILCRRDPQLGYVHRILVADLGSARDVAKMLLDKALGKLTSRGIHKCHISVGGPDSQQQFWKTVTWTDQTDHRDPPATYAPAEFEQVVAQADL